MVKSRWSTPASGTREQPWASSHEGQTLELSQLATESPEVIQRARDHARMKLAAAFNAAAAASPQKPSLQQGLHGRSPATHMSRARHQAYMQAYQGALSSPRPASAPPLRSLLRQAAASPGNTPTTPPSGRHHLRHHLTPDAHTRPRPSTSANDIARQHHHASLPPSHVTQQHPHYHSADVSAQGRSQGEGHRLLRELGALVSTTHPPHDQLLATLSLLTAPRRVARTPPRPTCAQLAAALANALHPCASAPMETCGNSHSTYSQDINPQPLLNMSPSQGMGTRAVRPSFARRLPVADVGSPQSLPSPSAAETAAAAAAPRQRDQGGARLLLRTQWLVEGAQAAGDGETRRWISARLDAHARAAGEAVAVAREGGVAPREYDGDAGARVEGDGELRYTAARSVARALLAAACGGQ